ncbi:MAG: restriction endonuclease subunit S [Parabacteroides sp.]|nr:restriction endonuclease subunit S [Parabacteroides sp.]
MKQGWEIKKIKDICDKASSNIAQNKIADIDGDYPVFGASGFVQNVNFFHRDSPYVGIVKDGAGVGRVNIYPAYSSLLGTLQYIIPKKGFSLEYVAYALKSLNLSSFASGATIPHIYFKNYGESPIPVPPLAEQEKIVAELDCLSGIIEKKKQQLKELDALAQSIFYEMFGNPVDNEKGWDTKQIEDICDVYRGGSPRPIDKFLGGNIPWIKIGDATQGDSIFLTKTKEHIIEEGLRKTRFIHSGSLIFANCGVSLGFARIITFDGCIHDGWLAFDNISEEIDKIFFLKSLNFCTPYFRSIAPDGVQPNLNTSIMKAFNQIIPPLIIQKNFVDKICSIEKQKSLITQSLGEAEVLYKSRMDYYFN